MSQQRFTLVAAFLGWMFAGVVMSLLPLAADSATKDLLGEAATKEVIGAWFVYYIVAFMLGAALGGLLFGMLGDRWGRVKGMGLSILWFSAWTGISYVAVSPAQLAALRFVACMGVGGMWPNGVALVSEAWPNVSRPALAGLIGTSANVGIFLFGLLARQVTVTADNWRWVLWAGATPIILGLIVLKFVPESPLWLASRGHEKGKGVPAIEVFRPPVLQRTLIGILLGAIPLLGAWGAGKWILPWAGSVGAELGDATLKPTTQMYWGLGAVLGSLAGGWLASSMGRRTSYLVISIASALVAGWIFRGLQPASNMQFFVPIFLLGLITTTYFGWLPLFLPELFETRIRATGAGVAFNFGRIISAAVILSTTGLVSHYKGDFARIGETTSLVYLLGAVVIWFAPSAKEVISDEA
ncbi:MAG: MFS transporter [Planctomycetaceae bacterium]